MQPLRFDKIKIDAIWGYEEWILSSIEGRESVLTSSPTDENLAQLVEKYKQQLVGNKVLERYGSRFPILIKKIKTHDKLSVQVHPSDSVAQDINRSASDGSILARGKSEMWYIAEAERDSSILLGLRKQYSNDQFEQIVQKANGGEYDLTDALNRIVPQKGDYYYVPAGRVHALGANLQIIEIQQSSTTTYRLYDYNRRDTNGCKRQLHIAEALKSINLIGDTPCSNRGQEIADVVNNSGNALSGNAQRKPMTQCDYFKTEYITLQERTNLNFTLSPQLLDSFVVIIATEGNGEFFYPESDTPLPFKKDNLFLLPASLEKVDFRTEAGLEFIIAYL